VRFPLCAAVTRINAPSQQFHPTTVENLLMSIYAGTYSESEFFLKLLKLKKGIEVLQIVLHVTVTFASK
jgi:hypothetical protein